MQPIFAIGKCICSCTLALMFSILDLRKYFSWKKNWSSAATLNIGHQRVQLVHWFVATNSLYIYSDSENMNVMCLPNLQLYACHTHTSISKDVCGWISFVYATLWPTYCRVAIWLRQFHEYSLLANDGLFKFLEF